MIIKTILIDPNAGKDWGQEKKGATEDEMIGWHHRLNGLWVWASSGRWWWTGKPGVLQSMGSQRVGHNWATEQQQKSHVEVSSHAESWVLAQQQKALTVFPGGWRKDGINLAQALL